MIHLTRRRTHGHAVRAFLTALGLISALCMAVLFAACGKDSEPAPTAPTPAPPAPRLLLQGSFALRAPTDDFVNFALVPVTDATSGLWQANVDWAIETNTLWMWVTDGVCTGEQFARPECPFESTCPCRVTVRSETATPKPRVLTIPGAPGGTRTLIVANLGPREEAVQYSVTLQRSSSLSPLNSLTSAANAGSGSRVSTGWKLAPHIH